MIALLLTLAAACPSYAQTNTSTAACDAVAECATLLAAEPVPATFRGVPPEALPYAARLYRMQRCAWAAETRAQANAAALAVVRPLPLCPPVPAVECPVCGVTVMESLACVGACAIVGGVVGAVGVARCQ